MKKYSKSIEVKGENIKELFDCPVVTDIKKATEAVDDGLDVGDMLQHVIAMDYSGSHKQVKRGSVLAMDVCGHWEIMTADEWEERKEDTITGDDNTETPPTTNPDETDKNEGEDGTKEDNTSSSSGTEGDLLK